MSNDDGPQKILLLNHNRRGVGTFFRCWHLARNLAELGFEVTLLTGSPSHRFFPSSEMEDGVHIVETPNLLTNLYAFGSGYGAVGIPYRTIFTLRRDFDIVHAFDHKPNVLLPAVIGHRIKGIPLVADWCDWWGFTADGSGLQERRIWPVATIETALEEYIHTRADWVTTISTGLRDRAVSLGTPPDRVTWIPSGAPSDLIQPLDRDECRKRLGIPSSVFLVGHAGIGARDIGMVLPILAAIRNRRPEVRLGLIGPVEDPRSLLRPSVREIVLAFGPVPFSQLPVYLGACNAFILPLIDTVFNRTRWPNKFGDYLAAGRPILCTNVGDVGRIVESEGCGFAWTDGAELTSAIESLAANPDLALQMGNRGEHLATSQFSWHDLAEKFVAVYRTVWSAAT